ncbi:MAG TPA: RluA family pseudouridine synthase [Gammaproteobacteria bacterium]|nr:RluA family pseudouridine synthase [Gammaproteobacteria bacterium]
MLVNNNGVSQVTISEAQAGQRIDNFLLKHLKGVPKSHIYRLLRSGQIRINSGRKKPHYKLQAGDNLRLPPIHMDEGQDTLVPERVMQSLKQAIIFENDDIIAINKPSGIAVHKGSGLRFGIIEAFRQLIPEQPLELVHRLDRETSGCLLLAKNRQILARLHELLRHEKTVYIEKTYIALLDGLWQGENRTIDIGMSKIKRGGEHIMQIDKDGDRAISHFSPLELFDHDTHPCSLMKITIETGRTHQIRAHAQHTGHPVAGDSKYGDKASNRLFRELGLKRLFLHAQQLYLPLANPISIQAPVSDDLSTLIEKLRHQH